MAKSGDTIQIGWEGWMAMEPEAHIFPYYYIGWLVLILNTCACIRSMESETRLGSALGD